LLNDLGDGRLRTQSVLAHSRYRLAPKITTPTKNAAASARFPRRVEVTFFTIISV
jgi:hypothetical protein